MSIQNGDISISANFQLNVSKPLDSRTIVSNFSDLANIAFKHSGMVVYVTALDAHFTLDSTNTWNLFSGQSGSLVADNGITISNDIIELGGDLVKTTSINTDNFNFLITNGTNGLINISDKILIGDWTTSSTPISGDSSYKIANTEFVTNAISLIPSYNGTLDRISVTSGIVDIDINYIGQTSINTVGALSNGSLTTGFTPINDAEISSASTWNAKQDAIGYTPENLTNKVDAITIGNGSNAYPTSDAVIDYIAFVQSRTTYVNNITGSDTTAEKYSTTLKYATIKKAILESAYGDTIRIENTGTDYTDHHMPMPDGVTVYAELGVVCKPTITTSGIPNQGPIFTTYNPTDMNDVSLGQSINDRVNFKVRGRGRFITRGWSGPDTDAFVFYRRYSTFDIEADEVSGFEHNGGGEYGTQVTFRNVLFTYQIDMYGQGHQVFNNCKFLDVLTQRRNLGFYAGKAVFNDCDFIRKETIIQYDLDASSRGLTDLQGLDCFAFKPASGGTTAYFHFNNCSFYNNVGGHGISLFAGGDNTNSSELHIDDCSFFLNNDTKSPLYYNGINGLNNNHLFYLSNNISNTEPIAVNGATLTNQYSGSGFTIITEPINLNSISATTPLSYNNTSGTFSIQVANISQNGYISSTDWNTFNSKQNTLSLTTNGTSGSSTLISNTLNIPTYTLQGLGGQTQLNGTGFVRQSGTTTSYVSGTSAQFVKADGSLDSTSYGGIKFTPNTYWVDPTNGSDSTGTYGREDLPYATLQYVWDLIPNGNTTDITIFIKGDYLATTHAIYEPTLAKSNITFTFLNEVTYSVNSTTNSRPLFSFYNGCTNLTFNVPSFTMTKQGGFIYSNVSEGHVYNFTNVTALTGIDVSINNNSWFIYGGTIDSTYCSLSVNKLNISITNDSNNLKNTNAFFILKNAIVSINEVNITGGATVSGSAFHLFASNFKNIYIKKLKTDIIYTNITAFKILLGGSVTQNILIDDFSTASNGSTRKSFALFSGVINRLSFGLFSSLCYQVLLEDDNCYFLDLGRCTTNGIFNLAYYSGQVIFNSINITGLSTDDYSFFILKEGSSLNGGQIKYDRNSSVGTDRGIISLRGLSSSKYITLSFDLINTNQNSTGRVFKPIMYYGNLNKIMCKNLVVSSSTDSTNDTLASWLQPYGDNTSHSITVEGTVLTNFVKTITNFTNNANTTIITNYVG